MKIQISLFPTWLFTFQKASIAMAAFCLLSLSAMSVMAGVGVEANARGTNSGGGGSATKQDFLRTAREVQNWLDENENGKKIRPQVFSDDIAEALNPDRIVPVQKPIWDAKINQWVDCYYDSVNDLFFIYGADGKGWMAIKEKQIKWRLFLHEIFRKLNRTMPAYDDDKYKLTPQIEFHAFSRFDFSKVKSGDYEQDYGNAGAYSRCRVNIGKNEAHQQITLSMDRGCISTNSGDNYTVTALAKCSESVKYGSACVAPFDLSVYKGGSFWQGSKWAIVKATMVLTFNSEGDITVTVYDAKEKLMTDQGMRLRKK